jgi:hypothetical protein
MTTIIEEIITKKLTDETQNIQVETDIEKETEKETEKEIETKIEKDVDKKDIFGIMESLKEFKNDTTDKENTQSNGKMFEDFVKTKCVSIGYVDVSSEKKKDPYKNLLQEIKQVYTECLSIPNISNYTCEKILIQQPNGSQKTPDLLLIEITKDSIQFQPIEVKTGKDYATWNNSYPKNDWIYIFSGKEGITYFLGKSLITENVIKLFEEYKELRKKLKNEFNQKLKDIECKWQLIDYFKFEHTSGVNYKRDEQCKTREKDVDDILLKFTGLCL